MKFTALLLAFLSTFNLASAWKLELYAEKNYTDLIMWAGRTLSQPCLDIYNPYHKKAISLKWRRKDILPCIMELFEEPRCRGQQYNAYEDLEVPDFEALPMLGEAIDVNSIWIYCAL
jgi:hypothetical protein